MSTTIQGLFYHPDGDAQGFCELNDPNLQTLSVRVGQVEFSANADFLGYVEIETCKARRQEALEAAALVNAAPRLLEALQRLLVNPECPIARHIAGVAVEEAQAAKLLADAEVSREDLLAAWDAKNADW